MANAMWSMPVTYLPFKYAYIDIKKKNLQNTENVIINFILIKTNVSPPLNSRSSLRGTERGLYESQTPKEIRKMNKYLPADGPVPSRHQVISWQ